MDCVEFKDSLLDLFYGERPEAALTAAKVHLNDCSSCRTEWNHLEELRAVLSKLPEGEPAPYSLNKIRAVASERPVRAPWWSAIFCPSVWAPAMVVLFFVVALAKVVLFPGGEPNPVASNLGASPLIQRVATDSDPLIDRFALLPDDNRVLLNSPALSLEENYKEHYSALLETNADMLLMRGRRFKSMGRIDLALRDFETLIRFYPNYTYLGDALMYRAQCYAFQGHIDEAIASLELFMKRDPSKKNLVSPMIDQLKQSQPNE